MYKKSFIIFFVLIFLCSMISIVAFADVDYSSINSTLDFLKASEYSVFGASSGDGETVNEVSINGISGTPIINEIQSFDPINQEYITAYFNELQIVTISWTPVVISPVSKLYFYFTTVPNNTTIYINNTAYPLNYSDQISSYSAYYVTFARPTYIQDIRMTFEASQNNSGSTFTIPPGVISCFGFNMLSEKFTRAEMDVWYALWRYDNNELTYVDQTEVVIDRIITTGHTAANTGFSEIHDFYRDGNSNLLTTVQLSIDLQEIGPDYLNYFSANYSTCGQIREVMAWVGSDEQDAHDHLTNLNVTNILSDGSIYEFSFPDAEIQNVFADTYSLFIDLGGIDLKPYRYLNLSFVIEPIEADREFSTFSFFNLNSMTGYYSLAYDSSETIILSSITRLLLNSNNIYSALLSIQDYFTVDENQSEEVGDKSDSVSNQAGSLNDGISQLEQVDRPEINFSNMLANTGFNIGVMPTNLLSVITYNKYILPLLLFVFVGALGAYLVFGKR